MNGHRKQQRGMAMIAVLAFVVLGTWLAVTFLEQVELETRRAPSPETRDELRAAAYQTLELTIAVLHEIRTLDGGLYSPAQGWGDILTYAQAELPARAREEEEEEDTYEEFDDNDDERIALSRLSRETRPVRFAPGLRVGVRIDDRNGRFPFDGTSEERWQQIFQSIGFGESEAVVLRDSLMDWMDPDDRERPFGAESNRYRSRNLGYVPPNRPVEDMSELRAILNVRDLLFDEQGRPKEAFAKFRELVAVRPAGEVNWNTASPLFFHVMEEETGMNAERVQTFLAGRGGSGGILRPGINTADLPRDQNNNLPPLDREVGILDVWIRVYRGETGFLLHAVLDPSEADDGGVYPLKIESIRENLEPF